MPSDPAPLNEDPPPKVNLSPLQTLLFGLLLIGAGLGITYWTVSSDMGVWVMPLAMALVGAILTLVGLAGLFGKKNEPPD